MDVICRVATVNGRLRLSPPAGTKVSDSIPRAVREAFEKDHGLLGAGMVVRATMNRGRLLRLVPDVLPPVRIDIPKPYAVPAMQNPAPLPVGDGFVNPYAFVPFFTTAEHKREGEGAPLGHDRWHEDTFAGSIVVTFKTVTPLLTTELTRLQDQLPIFTVRRDMGGMPIVSGASVKGAVRSLVEQATGSRLGVFDGQRPIVRRMTPGEALQVAMGQVVTHKLGERLVIQRSLEPQPQTISYANPVRTVSVPMGHLAGRGHGKEVWAWLQLNHHAAVGQQAAYHFWQTAGPVSSEPSAAPAPPGGGGQRKPVAGEPLVLVRGRLHVTGRTFGGKHDERLFVDQIYHSGSDELVPGGDDGLIELTGASYEQVLSAWRTVIDSFAAGYPLNATPTYAGDSDAREGWKALQPGQTLFLTSLSEGGDGTGVQLMPGMITRKRYPALPAELLPEPLLPCSAWEQMSVADRLFGWVDGGRRGAKKGDARTAYRGQCRFGAVTCTSEDARSKNQGTAKYWTLATLNGPKPAQFRFYLRSQSGETLTGVPKTQGYQHSHLLAGHKVYVTHRGRSAGYWALPAQGWPVSAGDKTSNVHAPTDGRYQSWLAPQGTPAKVTAGIGDWVEPGVTFEVTIRVDNLRRMELGALLWVLDLGSRPAAPEAPFCVKLGKGRPLGFGAVRMTVDSKRTVLRTHQEQRERYSSLVTHTTTTSLMLERVKRDFEAWLRSVAPATHTAMLASAKGFEEPIHYPRLKGPGDLPGEPAPTLETYQWFVCNERGSQRALPLLDANPPLLPYQP